MRRVKNSIIIDFKEIEHLAEVIENLTTNVRIISKVKQIKAITNKYN